jgi:hypothetical protein
VRRHVVDICFSLLLLVLLLAPITASNERSSSALDAAQSPAGATKTAETGGTWYNDCSNITGFALNDNWNTGWGDPWTLQDGSLELDGSMLSITSVGSGSAFHGSIFEYELPNGIRLCNISSFAAVMHADNSVQTYMGYHVVMLGDQDRNPVLFFSFGDGWKDHTQGAYGVSYVFLNNSRSSFGSGYPVTWTSFSGFMNASFTAQGLLASVEGVGDLILPGLNATDLDREVKYVAVGNAQYASYPMIPVQVDDISLTWGAAPSPVGGANTTETIFTWHNDCSNTAGFVYTDTWNMTWITWQFQSGTLESDGSMLSVTDVAAGSGYHGPAFEFELPSGIPLRDIHNFSAVMHADNSLPAYMGYQVVMLGDQYRNPVLFFGFGDAWKDYTQGAYGFSYVFLNGSRTGFGSYYPGTWTAFDGLMNVSVTEQGLLVSIEGLGSAMVQGLNASDFDRQVKYVAIASARYGSDPMFPVLVDDISLNYETGTNPPQRLISTPEDIEYEAGTAGNTIDWTVAGFNPTSYELYRSGGLLESGLWAGGSSLSVSVDNLYPGRYNYTVVIHGDGGVRVVDTVYVSVKDTIAPSLGHPSDGIIEYGSSVNPLQWSVSDLYPWNYTLFIDGVFAASDSWTPGSISQSIEGLSLGEHDFFITVFDAFGNVASDTVVVTVLDTTPPVISHPSDFTVTSGSTDIPFNWTVTDLLPATCEVYMNGSIVDSGTWSSGANITVAGLDTLSAGVYNYTLVVYDTSGNRAVDTVLVVVAQPWYGSGQGMVAIGVTAGGLLVIIIVGALIIRNRGQQPSYSDYYYSG